MSSATTARSAAPVPSHHRPARHGLFAAVLLAGLVLTASAGTGAGALVLALVVGLVGYGVLSLCGVWTWLAALAAAPSLSAVTVLLAGLGSEGWRTDPGRAGTWVLAGAATVGVALAACAGLGLGRAAGSRVRPVAAATGAIAVVVGLAAAAVGSWGDPGSPWTVTATVSATTAGALGLTALLRGRRGRSAGRPQCDRHDEAALSAYRATYPDPALAPVVLVVAAYNESPGLTAVLDELPLTVCGLDADLLVVDDGSSDGTREEVQAHPRARLVASPVNRGQGAALRLGYRVAREHGARYVVTTDADGQYDPADIPVVLAPLLAGTADFVTGSRRRGGQETRDRVRRLGVHVFAWLVSTLTGHWVTDTSFGLRAMRAEVSADVTLNQPQYQSSELMIGVLSHGWRVLEVPGRMRLRNAGTSKKGGNLVYGSRYARVVIGTWWREGCPSPARVQVPAVVTRRWRTRRPR